MDIRKFFSRWIEYYDLRKSNKILLIGFKEDVYVVNTYLLAANIHSELFLLSAEEMKCDVVQDMRAESKIIELAKRNIDIMVICTDSIRFIIRMLLISNDAKYRTVDLYDDYEMIMNKRLVTNFGSIRSNAAKNCIKNLLKVYTNRNIRLCNNYDALFCRKHSFANAKNKREKEFFCNLIIEDLYYIKDIKNLIEYVNIYCANHYKNHQSYRKFLNKLLSLLDDIKKEINLNEGIVIFWTDAISQKKADEIGFFKNKKEESVEFRNVYTHIPYTDGTIHSILTGCPYIEDQVDVDVEGFTSDSISDQKANLINLIKQYKYQLQEVGAKYIDFFEQGLRSYTRPSIDVRYEYKPSTINLWDGMCELAASKEKIIAILHCDCEPHHPYWGFNMTKMGIGKVQDIKDLDDLTMHDQRNEALKYLEEQILWYNSFISDKKYYTIMMSDHGSAHPGYKDERLKPYLMVFGKAIHSKTEYRKFSYLEFYKLIKWLITGEDKDYEDIFTDIAYVQNESPYGEGFIQSLKNSYFLRGKDFEKDYPLWCGFRGVIDDKYKAILLRNGELKFFSLAGDNEIDVPSEDIKDKYLKLIGNQFEDLSLQKYTFSRAFIEECDEAGYKI